MATFETTAAITSNLTFVTMLHIWSSSSFNWRARGQAYCLKQYDNSNWRIEKDVKGNCVLGHSAVCTRITGETPCYDSPKFGQNANHCTEEYLWLSELTSSCHVWDSILYITGLHSDAMWTGKQCSVIRSSTTQLNFSLRPADNPSSKTTHSVSHSRQLLVLQLIPTCLNLLWHFTKHLLCAKKI
jgi:hypothetical protein